jgi:hypothetical protein
MSASERGVALRVLGFWLVVYTAIIYAVLGATLSAVAWAVAGFKKWGRCKISGHRVRTEPAAASTPSRSSLQPLRSVGFSTRH